MIFETDPWRLRCWFYHVPTGRVSNPLFDLTPGVQLDAIATLVCLEAILEAAETG